MRTHRTSLGRLGITSARETRVAHWVDRHRPYPTNRCIGQQLEARMDFAAPYPYASSDMTLHVLEISVMGRDGPRTSVHGSRRFTEGLTSAVPSSG